MVIEHPRRCSTWDLDALLQVDQESLAGVAGVAANRSRVPATEGPTDMRAKLSLDA
jgi:hypothetical protein